MPESRLLSGMAVRPDLRLLAARFCRTLADDTASRPNTWRMANLIAVRCRILPEQAEKVIAFAVAEGWLLVEDGHSVALTEAGRRL